MTIFRETGFCALLKLSSVAAVLTAGTLLAQINAVYVDSNISSSKGNAVLGFSNDGFGNLTPLPNSPYLTQGAGWAPRGWHRTSLPAGR